MGCEEAVTKLVLSPILFPLSLIFIVINEILYRPLYITYKYYTGHKRLVIVLLVLILLLPIIYLIILSISIISIPSVFCFTTGEYCDEANVNVAVKKLFVSIYKFKNTCLNRFWDKTLPSIFICKCEKKREIRESILSRSSYHNYPSAASVGVYVIIRAHNSILFTCKYR
jgi:hypothetical protein